MSTVATVFVPYRRTSKGRIHWARKTWVHDVVPPMELKISHFEPRKYPANTPNTSLGSWQHYIYIYIYTEWKDEIWLQFHGVATNIYSTSNDSSPHVPMISALERHDIIYMICEDFHPFHFATFVWNLSLFTIPHLSKHFQPFPSSHAVGMAA